MRHSLQSRRDLWLLLSVLLLILLHPALDHGELRRLLLAGFMFVPLMLATVRMKKHQSIKISYSDGTYVHFGGNYQSVSVAWQYSWIGWPKLHAP